MTWHWTPDETSPALAPAPPPVEEREYEVTGPHRVLGHEPGSRFRATLPLEQEAVLIWAGHIQRAAAKPAGRNPKKEQPSDG